MFIDRLRDCPTAVGHDILTGRHVYNKGAAVDDEEDHEDEEERFRENNSKANNTYYSEYPTLATTPTTRQQQQQRRYSEPARLGSIPVCGPLLEQLLRTFPPEATYPPQHPARPVRQPIIVVPAKRVDDIICSERSVHQSRRQRKTQWGSQEK